MIKARAENPLNGRTYFIIGITDADFETMKAGRPAGLLMESFKFAPGTGPHTIVLLYGETYDKLREEIGKVRAHPDGIIFPTLEPVVLEGLTN